MKQLLVIAAAVLGLASCGSSNVTCMMLEDGEVKVIPSQEYHPVEGDTVVVKLMVSPRTGATYNLYGKYLGVIPERGHFYYGDSILCMYSYHKALVLNK
jgi:hypothetical protein